jgi:hypothetical protein
MNRQPPWHPAGERPPASTRAAGSVVRNDRRLRLPILFEVRADIRQRRWEANRAESQASMVDEFVAFQTNSTRRRRALPGVQSARFESFHSTLVAPTSSAVGIADRLEASKQPAHTTTASEMLRERVRRMCHMY